MSASDDGIVVPSIREESPASNESSNVSELESDCSPPDSGVVLEHHRGPAHSNRTPYGRFPGQRSGGMNTLPVGQTASGSLGPPVSAVPLTELRRPSIVEMVNNGGLVLNQGGSYEINMDNVLPEDVEMMYALHGSGREARRGSADDGVSSCNQQLSEDGSGSHVQLTESTHCFAARRGWWRMRFNSAILEKYWKKKVVEFLRRRFRIAVMFIGFFTLLWIVFFSVHLPFSPPETLKPEEAEASSNELAIYSVQYSWWYVVGGAFVFAMAIVLLLLTYWKYYGYVASWLSLLLAILLMCCSWALALALKFNETVEGFSTITFVVQFVLTAIVFLIIFTLSHFRILISLALCTIYLVALELLVNVDPSVRSMSIDEDPSSGQDSSSGQNNEINTPQKVITFSLIARLFFYICLMIAGISTAYLSQLRLHATFWKIAQCVLSQEMLDLERELEEKTILSMMPKPFADELLSIRVQLTYIVKQNIEQEGGDPALQSISLPFSIHSVDRVTILFADIVDFTEFSSNLSAAELVGILNEIFCTFDDLATQHQCEKISTLGDCYFCVSGCPEPQASHAENCVNMGLAIVEALDNFRKRTQHSIEMRVGIHTGSVFCGVMGTRKFKFDVWSKDTTIANRIESICTPGRVLISAATRNFLSSTFVVEEANVHNRIMVPELDGLQLYYVVGRRSQASSVGTSVLEWKRKIKDIDTIHKPDDEQPSASSISASAKPASKLGSCLCLPLQRKKQEKPASSRMRSSQSTSSLVDIFSKQTQLRRCTSYAELTNPQEAQQTTFDRKIVDFMEEQKVNFDTYFDPQLNKLTLQFHEKDWEAAYRNYGRDLHDGSDEGLTETELGFQITKLAYMVDTTALFLIFLLIMSGSAIQLNSSDAFVDSLLYSWLGVFLVGFIVEVLILFHVAAAFKPNFFPACFKYSQFMLNWYVRSIVALFLIYYPMTVVYVGIAQCQEGYAGLAHVQMSFFVTVVVLISSMNFMEISYLVKLIAGFLSASLTVVMVVVVHLDLCIKTLPPEAENMTSNGSVSPTSPSSNRTDPLSTRVSYLQDYYTRHIAPEAIILLLLIWMLLLIVNRMSEVSVRLSFIGRVEAAVRKRFTHQRKIQAEWLLFNIIPPRVVHQLRKSGKYSCNHDCVGVIFASIVNFNEYYRSQTGSDEESLRLLNQIISEFDSLLAKTCFANVEKIKTIGSTYMAASGLSLPNDHPSSSHLMELIDFAQQLIETLRGINYHVPNFSFRMRIGFNYGPITSGVVGSHKMLYDIWGDTVNVASRMESTGQVGKIHMSEDCLKLLESFVVFEFNKVINVKGKGAMRTVFVSQVPMAMLH